MHSPRWLGLASVLRSLFPAALGVTVVACGSADTSAFSGGDYEGRNSDARSSDAGSSAQPSPGRPSDALSGETYGERVENAWVETSQQPSSTFGVDVDTGSDTLMRRDITARRLPNPDGVRVEEYINYFGYDYAQPPRDDEPFAVRLDGAPSKFGEGLHLLRVGLQGRSIDAAQRKPANLIFLVDVSGSMSAADKLPLVQYTLRSLVEKLSPKDTLGIVTYAGYEKVLLAPTPVTDKARVIAAIDGLTAGGSTNGEGGIKKAYALLEQVKLQQPVDSINRVILCTDGDFNVGVTGSALVSLIEVEREKGITLSTFGYGQGNYNDREMEALADKGNGNYAYIDAREEVDRIVQKRLVSTLQVIAKDTKIQVALDPTFVQRYRLVGCENRVLANEDFTNDKKDSGELGAGHSVTAFYEIELTPAAKAGQLEPGSVASVKLRWKAPDGDVSTEAAFALASSELAQTFEAAPNDFRFAAAATEYAEILRRSKHSQGARFEDVIGVLASTAQGRADRLELVNLARTAQGIFR